MEGYTNLRYEEIRAQREARRQIRGSERVAAYYETTADDDPFAEQRPKNAFAKVLLVQGIACVAMLALLLLVRGVMPSTYRQLQRGYAAVMQIDMSVREVWAAMGGLFGNLREDIYVVAPHRELEDELTDEEAVYLYDDEIADEIDDD